ncbi:MAG: hypothetical protein NZL99_09780 [Burkholderiaceae bacterium]|nr:hypothetical protein [Burkholderiaceae bacterium]MCX8003645.1 hypothetical protein [Burkholderiaceae bacterium]
MSEAGAHTPVAEDKWLEFLATEPRLRAELAQGGEDALAAAGRMRRVEARAAYWWLLSAALLAWVVH